jgi:hypothetical protein
MDEASLLCTHEYAIDRRGLVDVKLQLSARELAGQSGRGMKQMLDVVVSAIQCELSLRLGPRHALLCGELFGGLADPVIQIADIR